MLNSAQKYQRCLVFAGGGFRFAYYLGIYAAVCQAGKRPDLILATCGGAIAAAVIHALPDDQARKDWLSSPQMYQFWQGFTPGPQAQISRQIRLLISRFGQQYLSASIPDLWHDYLFEIPDQIPLPEISEYSLRPDIAIIGAQLLYSPNAAGKTRGTQKLFAETVFSNHKVEQLLAGMHSPVHDYGKIPNAIAQMLQTQCHISVADAVRISISDMYYFASPYVAGHHYLGGAIDLFPIEIAKRLAREVIMEKKAPYDFFLSQPALKVVLGLNANQRLAQVQQMQADHWVDTSDMHLALATATVKKQLDWRANQIRLAPPSSYAAFTRMIQQQWDYGYQRGKAGVEA